MAHMIQKKLDYRWEFTPEENWDQAPKYPIRLIRAGQREFYSTVKFDFEIKDFWLFIVLPFLPALLFACFESLNYYVHIIDFDAYDDMNSNNDHNAQFALNIYNFLNVLLVSLLPIIIGIIALVKFHHKYQKQFYASGVAFYFIHSMLSSTITGVSTTMEKLFIPLSLIWKNSADTIAYVQIYSELAVYLVFCLVFIFTVKDIRRGWKLLFKLRANLNINLSNKRLRHFWMYRVAKDSLDQQYSHWIEKNQLKKLLVTFSLILIIFSLVILANESGNWIISIFNFVNNNQQLIQDNTKSKDLLILISLYTHGILLAPLMEEFVCRYSLMNMANNSRLAMFISAMVFGILHDGGSGILGLWSYLGTGLVLAFFYRLTGNIWFTVAAHLLNNFISYIN